MRLLLALLALVLAFALPAQAAPYVAPCLEQAITPNAPCNPVNAGNPMPVIPGLQPGGVTPSITAVFSGADTTTATATLAGVAGKFTYICGFNIGGLGATGATIVSPTVGTVVGGNTLTYSGAYTFPAGAAVAATPFNVTYNPCIPANAVNTGIVVTVPGAAGNTSTTINAWGFQQ